MLLIPSRIQRSLLPYVYLMPFGLLVLCGVTVLWGWETGNVSLVQPRSYDAALPANACVCFILVGLAPLAIGSGWRRTGLALGLLATLLAAATVLQGPLNLDLGIDNLLVRHESVTAGSQVARMPAALASVFVVTGLLLVWLAVRPKATLRPLLLALLGSLGAAYGLTGLVAYRNGLNTLEAWQAYAGLGPHTAVILVLMGGALIGLAARDDADGADAGPRWLWLPIVVCSATVTATLWIALRQRELAYTNSTTQLTINNIAALFSGESDAQILSLSRLAKRWTGAGEISQGGWEADAAEFLHDAEGYQSLQWADATLHTRWYWPHQGNEDAPLFDHASNPVRRAAVEAARRSGSVAIAAPIDSPLQPPSFALYIPVLRGGISDGFVVGEFYYDKFFDTIDRRLNLSRRYHLLVTIQHPTAALAKDRELKIYEAMTPPETVDERLRQSAYYNILNQRLTVTLTPRPAFLNANRQYLPEVVLFSGLGVSLLFGLVVNLAQSARRRQLGAERTSDELRTENQARRRVEARLKTADERLNLAFESTQVGVYEWDVETDQVYCTPSIWKIIGYDPAEMPSTGQGWLNLLHADDQPAVRAVIDAHFRGETPLIEIEHCVLHHTGEWLWIALRAKCTSFSATKQPRRVLGTMQNINARKRADEALRASQAESRKLSLVASKTDNSVIITDHEGRIEWVNESYSRLTGRALDEVTGQPLAGALASPEGDPGAVGRIAAALAGREPITTDAVQLATGDRRFHVHLDVQPVLSDEGAVENFIAIETDITARVETEQQLRRAKADADAASRAKSEFLASMSHEIRTPMNGVIGMTSLMLETELTPEQRDYITTIRTSGDALLTIINEILDFSKIESGKMELDNNPFELTQCIENVIDMFTPQAGAKQIELAYVIDPAVPRCVLGDISRVRQVLVNLMNNAIKFTASGFVTLEVGPGDAAPASRPGDKIMIDFCVTDTGIGIPPERLGLLFKPFSQVDSSTTRKYGGTGLGLAICDRLCQLMGGRIDVQSTPGQGSRFQFCIQTSAVDLGDQSLPPAAPLAAGARVLAVDAHPVNRAMLANCLKSWALTPVLASDATEALAAATGPLSAAVIDQPLPTGAGLDLAAALRTARPELPVILLTAAAEGSRPPAIGDPLVFHLPKPIKPHLLQDLLSRVMVGGGAAAASVEAPVAPAATVRLAETIPLDILLVEDNPVNQKVALRYLERMGYRADAVGNGLEAVQAVHARNYHLLFMDVQMPEMDGFTATREIRAQIPPERQPIIVALTANAIQGDRERCLESGMNEYITKPVKIEQIQAVITRFFGSKPG